MSLSIFRERRFALGRFVGHLEWIPRGRGRFCFLLCHPEKNTDHEFTVEFFGSVYRGNLNDFIDWNVFFIGAYSKYTLIFLRDLASRLGRQGTIFVDLGANVGQHSLFMSRYCEVVHSFEPFETVRKRIIQKVTDNNLGNIEVHGVGLGSHSRKAYFFAPTGVNKGTGSFLRFEGHPPKVNKLELSIVQGDEYFSTHQIKPVTILKMDVQGFEKEVLQGLRATLDRDRPYILMEFSGKARQSIPDESSLRLLSYPDCRIYSLMEKRCGRRYYRLKEFRFDEPVRKIVISAEEKASFLPT